MAHTGYAVIPILESARRCGLSIDERTVGREEVEASCPFCGDHGAKRHLYLNTKKNVFWCHLCGAKGNSVSLYARLEHKSYRQAADELIEGCSLYPFPSRPEHEPPPEPEPLPISVRHDVYFDLLSHLSLSEKHRADLRGRGLSDERIDRNMYRTFPSSESARRFLAGLLADFHNLDGVPGFYRTADGHWSVSSWPGLLIPVCDRDGFIQGIQIRLDDASNPKKRYGWLSSTDKPGGAKSGNYIHVTGDRASRTAYLTEGGLKGDVASFLDGDALFVCFAGVNSLKYLRDVLKDLDVDEVRIAMDMDKLGNWRVQKALDKIRNIIASLRLPSDVMNWNVGIKGVDDFYHFRRKAQQRGMDLSIRENEINAHLDTLWRREYPGQDRGFIYTCEWEKLTLPIAEVESDAPRDMGKAQRYLTLLRQGTQFPPLVCVNGMVIDGRHRFWACRQAGYPVVEVYQNRPWVLPKAA